MNSSHDGSGGGSGVGVGVEDCAVNNNFGGVGCRVCFILVYVFKIEIEKRLVVVSIDWRGCW